MAEAEENEQKLNANTKITLLDGVQIPQLGFGVYQVKKVGPMQQALTVGYRHIDTADFYGNEAKVGEALRSSGLNRDDVFLTSKVWPDDHGYDACIKQVKTSLKKLSFKSWDLFLIHSPGGGDLVNTWKALMQCKKDGLIRSIGVSNFGVQHLKGLEDAGLPLPSVNQIELHPWCQQTKIVEYCEKKGIAIEAYSPLVKGNKSKLSNSTVMKVAKKHSKSTAQVLIRWSLQKGWICLPKSSNNTRIQENFDIFDFELDGDDMSALNGLNKEEHCTWNPTTSAFNG